MLTIDPDHEENPLIVADAVRFFISDRLRDGSISLYSAFLLNQDELSLRRSGYRQPAWCHPLSLSGVLALYMQYLFGLAIGEAKITSSVAAWLEEDISLLDTERKHYIREYVARLPKIEPTREHLIELSRIRSQYEELSDDDGPYHTEVFPYDYFSPEDALLGASTTSVEKGEIDKEVEEIMLKLGVWN